MSLQIFRGDREEGRTAYRPDIEILFQQYSDMVYKIAWNQTGNYHDAEDVFQDVFVQLIRYQSSIRSEEHARAWLIRVTVNRCRKLSGSAWNRHRAELDPTLTAPERADPELWEEVAKLPDKYRLVIHLFYYEGMKIQEIARILECSDGTVKSQLSRARGMLKISLEGGGYVG